MRPGLHSKGRSNGYDYGENGRVKFRFSSYQKGASQGSHLELIPPVLTGGLWVLSKGCFLSVGMAIWRLDDEGATRGADSTGM